MKHVSNVGASLIALALASCASKSAVQSPGDSAYRIAADASGFALTSADGARARFDMRFCILRATQDPAPKLLPGGLATRYNVATWVASGRQASSVASVARDASQVGDGFDPNILEGDTQGRTADFLDAAARTCLDATSFVRDGKGYRWRFPDDPSFALDARLDPAPADAPPRLRFELRTHAPGYYSVVYAGAPAHASSAVDAIWQPLVWTEKRFPDRGYLTLAFRAPVPTTLVTHDGQTEGVVVDAMEFPFDPLPVFDNSRFGVALRNTDGQAQPMVAAPVLGGVGSRMEAGARFQFVMRPLVRRGDISAAFEYTARKLYGFHDYRHNDISSINRTLERIIDYGMSPFAQFREDDKGSSYETDAPGTVKNVSSLNPLDLALVTDDRAIWDHRVHPYIEYMVSREKYLFTIDETQKIQHPSYTLRGPAAPISELTTLHRTFRGASPAFLELAKQEYGGERVRNLDVRERGDTWQNSLALYRGSGERAYLEAAVRGADEYLRQRVAQPQSGFAGVHGEEPFFWTQFVPDFASLTELYEATGKARFLEAAHQAARAFTQFVWFSPAIPDGNVVVNRGGMAPLYGYLAGKGHQRMSAPEESAPAWRLSEIGLTPESSGTSTGHRGIFMSNWAPWLLRIGTLTDDAFLREVARSSIVGRYRNFPGYHINTARTTIYEKADYPLRDPKSLSVNSFHFNHIWPMASMLLDYLVTDAGTRSGGRIHFPSEFIEGYAYLQNRAYGAQVGRFFDHDDAVLWMPKGLVLPESVELNYVAARSVDNQRLYVALMNESDAVLRSRVRLDMAHLPGLRDGDRTLQVLRADGSAATPIALRDGAFDIDVPARGLVAVVLADAGIRPGLQAKVMAVDAADAWRQPLVRLAQPAARGMVMRYGPGMQQAYVFLEDSKRDYRRVRLHWRIDGRAGTSEDDSFPWEFSVPLPDDAREFRWSIEGITPAGGSERSREARLAR